jgi:hypothetical protein
LVLTDVWLAAEGIFVILSVLFWEEASVGVFLVGTCFCFQMPGDFDCYRDEEGDCERSGIDDEIIDDSQDSDVLELNRVVDFNKKPHRTSGRSAAAAAVSGNRISKENCKGESQTVTSLSNISFNLTFASCFQTLYCRWLGTYFD